MFGTTEILAVWIPRSAALALGILTARIVDYKWFGKSEATLTGWLMKTLIFIVFATAILLGWRGIRSWYIGR